MNKQSRGFWLLAGAGILLAVALRLTILAVSCNHIPAFDDECKIALQAKQIAAGERPLLILASPYIFPLDAYLMAPFIKMLPRTAFGARVLATVTGLLALIFSLLILRRWGPARDIWPGVLLVLFAPAYLLSLIHGCAMPGYATLLMISALTLLLAQRQWQEGGSPGVTALATGLLAGLACSETMLCLPVLVIAGAMTGLNRNWRAARVAIPLFAAGAGLGLLPHLLAKMVHVGAFAAVQHSISPLDGFRKLFTPALDRTLPAAFGFGSPVFPDTRERIEWLSNQGLFAGIGWALILVLATITVIRDALRRWRCERWPSVDGLMAFTALSWMCLGLFLFSGRSHSHTYRYFTPLVWSFPFLVAGLYQRAGRIGRYGLGTLAIVIAALNISSVTAVLAKWRQPDFVSSLKAYDLAPAIRYLDSRGITLGYASYVDAYRFTFATDNRITLCQAYNERFPGWHVPFKPLVDASTNVAYVLSHSYRFTPERFEKDLAMARVKFHKEQCGEFTIYTDFTSSWETPAPRTTLVPHRVQASHNPADAPMMMDGQPTFWRCAGYLQMTGMWVSVEWAIPRAVGQILLDHGKSDNDHPETVHVAALVEGIWRPVGRDLAVNPEPFEFSRGHPVYGRAIATVTLPGPVTTTGLKIEIARPRSRYAWTLAELAVLDASATPAKETAP